MNLEKEIVKRMLRVAASEGMSGDGKAMARQLDAALMKAGFKLSGDLLEELGGLHPALLKKTADSVIEAVRELVGDHWRHNVYFRDFPKNVPDTEEFWLECIVDALGDPRSAANIALQLSFGVVNLYDLPKYGNYHHSYEEMVAAHGQFLPSMKDRVTILHLGESLLEEALALYYSLAGSHIPLNEGDRELLGQLAEVCLYDPQPEMIPVRENKAVINLARINKGHSLLVDTPTDILRLACALSGGDVTLTEKTKFKSFPRMIRRDLMGALDNLISLSAEKLADIGRHKEAWKRLGERLHPHEFSGFIYALEAFAVARGDLKARYLAAEVEMAFEKRDLLLAISLLAKAPGMLFRSLDRLLRAVDGKDEEMEILLEAVQRVIGKVSWRVILSVYEHFFNRTNRSSGRVFANKKGTAWVESGEREPLDIKVICQLLDVFDTELARRLSGFLEGCLVIDEAISGVTLPLSDKNKAEGFGIMPRGSRMRVPEGEILRFFMYWKEHHKLTDYDLSALMLDENFQYIGHVSWTWLSSGGYATHSGDITGSAKGASEFIDIDLSKIDSHACYVIPQVNVYCGESFEEVEESFFGFMTRSRDQEGAPFEARTVRMKSELRGKGKVALPLAFFRDKEGSWGAKWLHLYLNGKPSMNMVEANRLSTALLVRSIMEREYLGIVHLIFSILMVKCGVNSVVYKGQEFSEPVTFIGLEAPEGLPAGSKVITLANLRELIPA